MTHADVLIRLVLITSLTPCCFVYFTPVSYAAIKIGARHNPTSAVATNKIPSEASRYRDKLKTPKAMKDDIVIHFKRLLFLSETSSREHKLPITLAAAKTRPISRVSLYSQSSDVKVRKQDISAEEIVSVIEYGKFSKHMLS